MLARSIFSSGNSAALLMAALVGGVLGAGLLFFAYFVGIALVGAGLGLGWYLFYRPIVNVAVQLPAPPPPPLARRALA